MQSRQLKLTRVQCCVCEREDAAKIGAGRDYEYRTSVDVLAAAQCNSCSLVYLNPRPEISEFETIYPPSYHAFDLAAEDYAIVYKIRSRLEARRLLSWRAILPDDARILDVGGGGGFHLNLLKQYGKKSWQLEGIDLDKRAVEMAKKTGLKIHPGSVEDLDLPENHYDLAFMIQTVEQVEKPDAVLRAVKRILKLGGKLIIVTENTDSIDFGLFKKSYWGGYHFPRHWNLFNRKSLTKLVEKVEFEVAELTTQVSPVNWVYSIHNWLVDRAPQFYINQFTFKSTISLSAFKSLDILLQKFGRGALLRTILR